METFSLVVGMDYAGLTQHNTKQCYIARCKPGRTQITLRLCWQANTLGSWWAGLVQRHEQLQRWLTVGRPKCFWLTGFFNPQVTPMSCVHHGHHSGRQLGRPVTYALLSGYQD